MIPIRPLLAAGALALLAACADRQPLAPTPQQPDPQPGLTAFECRAQVVERTVRCARPGTLDGPRGDILGGQGQYVQLTSSNVSYNAGTQIFSFDVTVQNLLDQAIGTPDGVTVDSLGVRVFFHAGPVTTAGSGTVTVANADGTGTFTASGQPYFRYAGILAPNATSAAKTWQLNVPPTATGFAFLLYLDVRVQPRLVINEIMAHPATATEALGEWIEIRNAGIGRVDLNGYTIASGGDAGYTITVPLVVPGGGYVAIGGTTDTTLNGGAAVNKGWSSISLGNDDTDWIALRAPSGVTIDSVSWGAGPGDTPAAPPTGVARALVSADSANDHMSGAHSSWINAVEVYGAAGQRGSPGRQNLLPVHAVSLSAALVHGCVADSDGQAWCWGGGPTQLGNASHVNLSRTLIPVSQPAGVQFATVSARYQESCALSGAGTIWCWGFGPSGIFYEPQILANQAGLIFTSLATWQTTACGVDSSATARCWGGGQPHPDDGAALTFPGPVTQVARGTDFYCLLSAGRVWCSGVGTFGQLGDSTRVNSRPTWAQAKLPAGVNFQQVVATTASVCALSTAGQAYCWGKNQSGQLGNGSTNPDGETVPVAVQQPVGVTFASVSLNEYFSNATTCGVTAAGQAYCWGSNDNGRIGDGTTTQRLVPTAVVQRGVLFSTVSAGGSFSCALEQGSGQPFCWGVNTNGQVGDNTSVTRLIPVAAGR